MSSISNGIVLTTAMVVSTTVLYLVFSRKKTHPHSFQIPTNSNKLILRSCLYSEEKKKVRKKTKKRVKFAENVMVKEEMDNNKKMKEEQRKQNRVSSCSSSKCRNGSMEIRGMPQNRVALYKGMLRDRGHMMACCR